MSDGEPCHAQIRPIVVDTPQPKGLGVAAESGDKPKDEAKTCRTNLKNTNMNKCN